MPKISSKDSLHPFAGLPPGPDSHFKLYFYAAVLRVIEQVLPAFDSPEAALAQFPFLTGYMNELARHGLDGLELAQAAGWWDQALDAWETGVTGHLPLRALRQAAALDHPALTLLLAIGLPEEDARFGLLFDVMQGAAGQRRPTTGLLAAWWRDASAGVGVRARLDHLHRLGLAQVVNPEAARSDWAWQLPGLVVEALHGQAWESSALWVRYHPLAQLLPGDDLILPENMGPVLAKLPPLLAAGEVWALVVRGPQRNGRRTLLGAVAHRLGRGLLEITGLSRPDDERWRAVGPLATLLHALPVFVFDLGPGETAELPALPAYTGPVGIVLGRQGGLTGPAVERALTLNLPLPAVEERRRHWQQALTRLKAEGGRKKAEEEVQPHPFDGQPSISDPGEKRPGGEVPLEDLAQRFRLSSGNIRRAAGLALAQSALAGRAGVTLADAQVATRSLNRQALDTLAERLPACGDWSYLAASENTLAELYDLEARCRLRERLPACVGPTLAAQINPGVRALFSGPSGTGKTLAARILAAELQMDLYRLDLSAVVNKYIGETEKNLNRLLARAEELDVILLLDEGDALLTQRTSVQTANDRYANLETNYLLQRLESFEGILLVTTNAGERIDSAFQRRMDMVIDFRRPEAAERWVIWRLHLPVEHAIPVALLGEVAGRCELNGGQIRNAALHTALLALNDGGLVTAAHLEAAVRREYRQQGAVCPLRHPAPARVAQGSIADG